MAALGESVYVVVFDTKAHRDGPRLGLLEVTAEDGVRVRAVEVADWRHADGRASDLEAACALPGRPGELLAAESGSWEGRFGRLFHLRLEGERGVVLAVYELPRLAGRGEGREGDNFEGLACAAAGADRLLLLLGERGGSSVYEHGVVRWGWLDLATGALAWAGDGESGIEVAAPGRWPAGAEARAISDLYLDPRGTLWAVATADAGDNGPFRSLIYPVGSVDPAAEVPLRSASPAAVAWVLDGLKVEALGSPSSSAPGSVLALGTEDESLGGTWRPLFPPVPRGKEQP